MTNQSLSPRVPTGNLPNFLLAGVAKCGTTSLASLMTQHPQIFMTAEKELHFFDEQFGRGLEWYSDQFRSVRDEKAVGEATPTYVLRDEWVQRIQENLGEIRIVLILRHPVERAYSHFWFNKWRDRRDFGRAVEDELAGAGQHWGYVEFGRYIEIVERVIRAVPRDRLHVLLLDDLKADAVESLRAIYRFLSVDDSHVPREETMERNPAFRFRSLPLLYAMLRLRLWERAPRTARAIDRLNRTRLEPEPMDPEVRSVLLTHYELPNQQLAQWLGRDLSAWSR